MTASLDKSEPDWTLCLVRVLQHYLKRTETLRAYRKALFLPLRKTASGRLLHNTITSWLKQTIQLAYEVVGREAELETLHSVRAHEVRALSASWDALKSVSMAEIMASCRW